MTAAATILDVTADTFEREVLERSRRTLVLVDFWATWCGPCRTLGPVLEKLAAELAGQVALAKVDVDASPDLAGAFGVQSVPTVMLVRDGQVVDGFLGAQPESAVRKLLERHLGPAVDPVAEALALERAGDAAGALKALRALLEREAKHGAARAQLARLLALAGRIEEARQHLEKLSAEERESEPARAAAALVALDAQKTDLEPLRRAASERPLDVAARLAYGRALLAAGKPADGLETLLDAARLDLRFNDSEPRKALLEAFTALGETNPLTTEYRRRLSLLLTA